jgi:hypothetical protein
MKTRKAQLTRLLIITLLGCVIFAASVTNVQAGSSLRNGVKGAAAGALIGAAIGGSDGAAKGAMIGGGVGILTGSNDRRHRNDRRRHKKHKNKRKRAKQYKRRR